MGLEKAGIRVVFANDWDQTKAAIYRANFGAEGLVVADVHGIRGADLPDFDLATASFPCTDVSLAGNRAGLAGNASGTFWEFARILDELGPRRPSVVLLENVGGLGSSNGGNDLRLAIERLNSLGYWCDILMLDARRWIPQSRPRVFVVGHIELFQDADDWNPSELRPRWIANFRNRFPELGLQALPLELPRATKATLRSVVERLPRDDSRWWDDSRVAKFLNSLSVIQLQRVEALRSHPRRAWRTAYRRTRAGRPVWEVRADSISGCLRTARGGSSKQAVLELGAGTVRIRWMISVEYARLMGAAALRLDMVGENQALMGLGDAVCVPAVEWLLRSYVRPALAGQFAPAHELVVAGN